MRRRPGRPSFTRAADGTSLAYRVFGDEPDRATIVFTNGFATSDFYWATLVDHFADHARVVTWDLKGHGRSGPAHSLRTCTIADSADDLRTVMDAADVESATLVGFSLGCQIILEAWRHFPDRIRGLVPILGTYEKPFDHFLHPSIGRALFGVFRRFGPHAGPLLIGGAYLSMKSPMAHWFNQMFGMVGREVTRRTMKPFYDHFAMIDPDTWVAMGLAAQEHSAGDLLESIDCPTLLISGGRDLFTPQYLSLDMRDRIRDAEMVTLPDATHSGLFEFPGEIEQAIDAFLERHDLLVPGRSQRRSA